MISSARHEADDLTPWEFCAEYPPRVQQLHFQKVACETVSFWGQYYTVGRLQNLVQRVVPHNFHIWNRTLWWSKKSTSYPTFKSQPTTYIGVTMTSTIRLNWHCLFTYCAKLVNLSNKWHYAYGQLKYDLPISFQTYSTYWYVAE